MDLLTFDVLDSGTIVQMKPNNLALAVPTIDYREILITKDSIKRVVLEQNNADGVNIVFLNNDKQTVLPQTVTRVGAVNGTVATDYGPLGSIDTFGSDSVALLNAIKTLLGWI